MWAKVGSRVKFLHASDQGVITALLDSGMAMVHLDGDDMEIPVFIEDLMAVEPAPLQPKQQPKPIIPQASIVVPKPTPSTSRDPILDYSIIRSQGVQLAFDPILSPDGQADKFQVYLINATVFDIIYTLDLFLENRKYWSRQGRMNSMSLEPLGEFLRDQLNDSPEVEIDVRRLATDGTGPQQLKSLKIKPKVFFNRIVTAPLLNRPAHVFRLIEAIDEKSLRDKPPTEDLRSYTSRNIVPKSHAKDPTHRNLPHEVRELAEFIPELDLHIEALTKDHHKLSNAEIIHLQVRRFDAYIDQAIRLGVDRVYIIHGVGKGRLRDIIASRLLRNPQVLTFKNEYHPRYGYGATEVFFN